MGARHLVNLKRFVHVSTAFVLARMSGDTDERSIPVDFNNTYEQTKYESELAVRVSNIPYTIARPSIVVGDSTNGYAKHFRVFYSMFRLWLTGVVPRAPLDLKAQADVVPIDFVCEMLRNIAEDHRALGATVHVCSGRKSPMVSEIFLTGIDVFGQKRPRFSPPAVLRILGHPLFARLVPDALFEVLRVLRGHFPYLGSRTRHFSTHLLETWYADKGRAPEFKDYGVKLFQYCKNTRWGKLPLHQWRNECGST
jgi:thioester reductase-like protein